VTRQQVKVKTYASHASLRRDSEWMPRKGWRIAPASQGSSTNESRLGFKDTVMVTWVRDKRSK
jgi:hypothetical protein